MGGHTLKKQVGLRFDPRLLKLVDNFAKQKGMNRTEFVENAVRVYIAREINRERKAKEQA